MCLPASATDAGCVTVGDQQFKGEKSFLDNMLLFKDAGNGAATLTVKALDPAQSAGINAFNDLGAMTYQAIGSTNVTGSAGYGRLRTSSQLTGMVLEVGKAGSGVMIFNMTNGGATVFEAMRINATGNLVLQQPLTFSDATIESTAGARPGSCSSGNVLTTISATGAVTCSADQYAGTWSARSPGATAAAETAHFLGPMNSTSRGGTMGNISCNWSVTGVGGTTGVVVKIRNATDSSDLCSCTLGACTTTALDPLVCACNTAFVAAKTYTVQLAAGTDCATNPSEVQCSVELYR